MTDWPVDENCCIRLKLWIISLADEIVELLTERKINIDFGCFPANRPDRIDGNGMNEISLKRTKIISLLSLIIIAIILLAGSFSNFQLKEGSPFPSGAGSVSAPAPITGQQPVNAINLSFLQGIIAFLFFIGMIYLGVNIFIKINIRTLLVIVTVVAVLLAVLLLLPPFEPSGITAVFIEAESFDNVPLPIFNAEPLGPPPAELIWAAALILLVFLAGLGFLWLQSRRLQREESAQIAGELEKTIRALDAGENFNNVIIACYAGMVRAIHNEAGIDRNVTMTALEFEKALINYGLPGEAVRELTRLFEAARYSQHKPDGTAQKNARLFLSEIIEHLQSSAGEKI